MNSYLWRQAENIEDTHDREADPESEWMVDYGNKNRQAEVVGPAESGETAVSNRAEMVNSPDCLTAGNGVSDGPART